MHGGWGALGQVNQHSRWSLRTADQRGKPASFNLHYPISSSLSHPGGKSETAGQMFPWGHCWLGKRSEGSLCWPVPGSTREGLDQPRREEKSADQQVVPDDISVPLALPREKQRASKVKGINLSASKPQTDHREDEMPDLCSPSKDKHIRRGAHLNSSHAFPWEQGNCFVFLSLIFLLWLFLKYSACWRLGLKR